MSLINQMLMDLEKRGAAVPAEDNVRAVPVQSRSITKHALTGMVMAVAAGALVFAWQKFYGSAPAVPAPVAAPVVAKPAVAAISTPQAVSSLGTASSVQVATAIPAHSAVGATAQLVPENAAASARTPEVVAAAAPASMNRENHPAAQKRTAASPAPGRLVRRIHKSAGIAGTEIQQAAPIKRISPEQQAQDEYNQALALISQGRKAEARHHLRLAVELAPANYAVRQALVGLLLEEKHNAEAEHELHAGLAANPRQTGFAMLLARLQVERGALPEALKTLEKVQRYSAGQADYQSFLAAVLQRMDRHSEAVEHYQLALHLAPNKGVWLMGLGISLQALNRNDEARDAYHQALATNSLTPELQGFVQQRLKQL